MTLVPDEANPAQDAFTQRSPAVARLAINFGGDYNPEQWPREVWDEDVRLMQEAGVNLVSVGIFNWALIEPREGEFDFTYLDEVIDLLWRGGIDVDLGTPTAAPPAWFWEAHPEARPVTREGIALGVGSRGMASPSSPAYRRAAVRVAEQLAIRYGTHPAVVMWHVHNEYGAPVSDSYDEASVIAFRRWLSNRYKSLDALNTAWGTAFWGQRYGTWEEIDAPRIAATVTNPTQRLDFARFSSDALLECFIAERDAIRPHSPGRPITTNFMATECLTIDYWRWAAEVDVIAEDHYLKAARLDNHVLLAMDADLTRSLAQGRPWMLMEHSTSAVNWQDRNPPKRPGEMLRNSMTHAARGADGILFFQFRASRSGAEKFHSAMIPHAGTTSRLWHSVVELGHDLAKLHEVHGSVLRNDVAILWDWESFWAQDLEWRPSIDMRHRPRIEEYYTALWDRHVTVDFAHPEADLSAYRVVLAPSLYMMSPAATHNLEQFVERGGKLVLGFGSALVDEHDAVPVGGFAASLRSVLGFQIEELMPFLEGESGLLSNGGSGSIWADDIQMDGAEPVLTFTTGRAAGLPAVTKNRFGQGEAWYVATRLDPETLSVVLSQVIGDPVSASALPAGVEVTDRIGDRGDFRFFINHTDTVHRIRVDGRELLSGTRADGVLELAAGGVAVVLLTP